MSNIASEMNTVSQTFMSLGKVRCLGDMRQFKKHTFIHCQILFLNKVKYLEQVKIVKQNT